MQKRKTHFEQVPIEVAENALRQRTSKQKMVTMGSPLLRNPVPIRVGLRRFLRRRPYSLFLRGSMDFHREE
jgi:hypothetical protein